VGRIVVGLPLTLKGGVGDSATVVLAFVEKLRAAVDVPVETHIVTSPNVAAALHEFAVREAIDLALITAHGSSGLNERPYGSLASSLLVYGTLPVMALQDMASPVRDQLESADADDATRKPGLWNRNIGYPLNSLSQSSLWRHNQLTNRRPLQLS
jgi:hypothetical protein